MYEIRNEFVSTILMNFKIQRLKLTGLSSMVYTQHFKGLILPKAFCRNKKLYKGKIIKREVYILFVVVCSVKERETVDRCDPRFNRSVASSAQRHINVPATQDRSLQDASITPRISHSPCFALLIGLLKEKGCIRSTEIVDG